MQKLTQLPALPDEDDVYHVYAMRYGRADNRMSDENFILRDVHDIPMPLDFFVWVIRNAHRTVLVDTGFGARASQERGRPRFFDPVDGLAQIGIDPDTLEDIVITHLHYDHAGNIDRFAKARFHIQDEEVHFATGRCMCEPNLRWTFDVEDVVTLVRRTYADRVVFHDGDAAPWPGITIHAMPGHSASVQTLRVNTPRGPILLASDATHTYANLARHSPFIVTLSLPQTLSSYSRMLEISGGIDRLIPGHDPLTRKFYPKIEVNGIELVALHETPEPHDLSMLRNVHPVD